MKENLKLQTKESDEQIVYSTYSHKSLALIVFGGILLYFFFLKFTSVQLIFSKIISILFPFLLGSAIAFVLKIPMNFFEKLILKHTNSKFLKKVARGISLFHFNTFGNINCYLYDVNGNSSTHCIFAIIRKTNTCFL